jgi:uncharacterized protein YgbK (DUF1537 family)
MERPWFILADDLTGAADSAIAFARRRVPARVVWGDAQPESHSDAIALAYDAATRELDAASAARRHGEVLRRFIRPRTRLFKKIDSTLRGHPAEEIAAMLDVMIAHEPAVRAVLAPSFPATGRTVRAGQVRVHGAPLPFTEYWPQGRDHELANLVNLLETAGVHARSIPLITVRGEPMALDAALGKAGPSGRATVAVCDAETEDDLARLASVILDRDAPTFFIGSAGLAHALAQRVSRAGARRTPPDRREPSSRGTLVVVGSRAQASRAALVPLATFENARRVSVEPALLAGDLQSQAHTALAHSIGEALAAGIDVVVDLAQGESAPGAGNPQLVSALARLLAPAAREASALVATGGETAAALLARLEVEGIRLLDEIEPGISLGLTLGELTIPVVTKAGGFGNEDCLKRILSRLRFIRQTGTVA